MWPYPWTHVGTPSHLGHMDRVAATMPSQAHAGAAQEAPDIGRWEGQDVFLVRPSSCNVKGGIPSSRRYLPTYLYKHRVCDKPLTYLHSQFPIHFVYFTTLCVFAFSIALCLLFVLCTCDHHGYFLPRAKEWIAPIAHKGSHSKRGA